MTAGGAGGAGGCGRTLSANCGGSVRSSCLTTTGVNGAAGSVGVDGARDGRTAKTRGGGGGAFFGGGCLTTTFGTKVVVMAGSAGSGAGGAPYLAS